MKIAPTLNKLRQHGGGNYPAPLKAAGTQPERKACDAYLAATDCWDVNMDQDAVSRILYRAVLAQLRSFI